MDIVGVNTVVASWIFDQGHGANLITSIYLFYYMITLLVLPKFKK